jgi:betaine reductase
MANIVTIAETVGANRIVPTMSIPNPLGDPDKPKEEQWNLRKHRVEVALDSLTQSIEESSIFEVKI